MAMTHRTRTKIVPIAPMRDPPRDRAPPANLDIASSWIHLDSIRLTSTVAALSLKPPQPPESFSTPSPLVAPRSRPHPTCSVLAPASARIGAATRMPCSRELSEHVSGVLDGRRPLGLPPE